jgi:hypothetical protein
VRTTEKPKPSIVFISEAQYGKRSFISENIEELGLLCQDFYFKTARLILYIFLYPGISFSYLIWKEMRIREKKILASKTAIGMKLCFISNTATFATH